MGSTFGAIISPRLMNCDMRPMPGWCVRLGLRLCGARSKTDTARVPFGSVRSVLYFASLHVEELMLDLNRALDEEAYRV